MPNPLDYLTPAALGLGLVIASGASAQEYTQPPGQPEQEEPQDQTIYDDPMVQSDPMDTARSRMMNRSDEDAVPLTPEQQAELGTWPADQQEDYKTWPSDARDYYWSLTPSRQSLYWSLRDEDQRRLLDMTPEQQEESWRSLETRMDTQTPPPR
ncbi:MAG: hypothetical protein V2I27_14580 [Erythrobacter sp.]|jgi:hypothetical protein|nr:hypothetical protein [Erythrobacter sp.]